MKENEIAKIVHFKIETPITLSSSCPFVLSIENPREMFCLVTELQSQFSGAEGNFLLIRDDQRLSFENCGEMITDVYSLDFNDKKILNTLEKSLGKISSEGNAYELYNKLNTILSEYYSELFSNISLPLTYEGLTFRDIFKASGIRLNQCYDGALEKIVCYINTVVQLKGVMFFVFLNLKSILTDDELICLYKHCEREKVALLLIENNMSRATLPMESGIIITDDLCEIVDKMPEI